MMSLAEHTGQKRQVENISGPVMAFIANAGVSVKHGRGASCRRRVGVVVACAPSRLDPYDVLGIEKRIDATEKEVRNAYLKLAKRLHPDTGSERTEEGAEQRFDLASKAYETLMDKDMRNMFDLYGFDGLDALETMRAKAKGKDKYAGIDPFEFELMSDFSDPSAAAYLEMVNDDPLASFDPTAADHDDYCPRSVEEAIWNVKHHENNSARYYAAWWIARFKISAAEKTLVELLQAKQDGTQESIKVRKRFIIATGKVAQTKPVNTATLLALAAALEDEDYYCRHNAAEAIAFIADRNEGSEGFPTYLINSVAERIRKGADATRSRSESKISQNSLFDFEKLDPEVAAKLKKIIVDRNEQADTGNAAAGTAGVGYEDLPEPYEKLIKAAGNLRLFELEPDIELFRKHPIPLVKFAASKFLFQSRHDLALTQELCEKLAYGQTSPFTANVISKDLGDLGYVPALQNIVDAEAVSPSIKVQAIAKMLERNLGKLPHDELSPVIAALDDLVVS